MLEKKRNSKIKATIAVFMACIMLFGMCSLAATVDGNSMGMKYLFEGTYSNGVLYGMTRADINTAMKGSYNLVELYWGNTKVGYHKKNYPAISISNNIGKNRTNLRVYHTASSDYIGTVTHRGASAYSLY